MKKLRSLAADMVFMIRPIWKHSRLLVILVLLGSVIAYPLGLLATVSVAQAVIDRILAGGTMAAVLGVVGVYFLVYAVSYLLQNGVNSFYVSWKQEAVARRIDRDIFRQALRTDYRWLDGRETELFSLYIHANLMQILLLSNAGPWGTVGFGTKEETEA